MGEARLRIDVRLQMSHENAGAIFALAVLRHAEMMYFQIAIGDKR